MNNNERLIPVLIDAQGRVYGPDDLLPDGMPASTFVGEHLGDDPLAERFISLSQEQ